MVYIKKENYRIASICKLNPNTTNFETLEIKDGLAIEKRGPDKTSWYVICYIRFDEHEGFYYIDCIGNRIIDVPVCDWDCVKEMILAAGSLVNLANRKDPETTKFNYEN